MKKALALVLAVLCLAAVFAACGKKSKSKGSAAGTYVYDTGDGKISYTLNEDRTGYDSVFGISLDFTWKQEGDKVIITYEGIDSPHVYKLDKNGNLFDEEYDTVYEKQAPAPRKAEEKPQQQQQQDSRPDADALIGTYEMERLLDSAPTSTIVLSAGGVGTWTINGVKADITWERNGFRVLTITACGEDHVFDIDSDGSISEGSMRYIKK